MKRTERTMLTLALAVAFTCGIMMNAYAMHIMEGFRLAEKCWYMPITCL